jgi:molybdopterin/thiamine biosynthesis adenylyltransferase
MKRIVIIGAGALGSHLVQFLRNEPAVLRIIDYDRVEMKNTLSQFHSKPGVGKLKVEALKQAMQFLHGIKLDVSPYKLVLENVDALLQGADLVVDCLDNGVARRLVQQYVRAHDLACLHGALAADGGFGRVVWDQQFVIDDEAGAGVATCTNGEHLPFIALVAAYLARAVQVFVADGQQHGYSISPAGAVRI